MKNPSHPSTGACNSILILAAWLALVPSSAPAATLNKANTTTDLNLPASWMTTAPGIADIAQWTSTVTAANSTLLGADLGWGGIKIVGPGGLVTVGGANTLTIGASGIDLSTATQNLTLDCGLALQGKQSWKAAAGRTLNVAGTFTRTGAVVDFTGFTATATLGTLANETSGMLGPWATTGSTTTLNYVKSTAGVIAAYTGQTAGTAGTLANVTNPASNYSFAAAATLTGPVTANTLRYTGAAATVANAGFTTTLNGLMHAGTGALTISGAGNLVIGANRELVIVTNAQATTISSPIVNHSGGASALTYSGSGVLTLSGVNTYSGGTTVNAGTCTLGNNSGLGSGTVTLAAGTTFQQANFEGSTAAGALPNAFYLSGSGNVTMNIPSVGAKDIWLGQTVAGTGGLTVQGGTRALTLAAGNTFSGGVRLTNADHRVVIFNATSLGTGTFRSERTVAGSGMLETAADLSAGPGVVNAFDIAAGAYLNIHADASNHLVLAGPIGSPAGIGNLYKDGTATLTLAGPNTYTGATKVAAGTLACASACSLRGGALDISSGASAQLDFTGTRRVASLTLGGSAQTSNGSYGSATSGATYQSGFFAGPGTVTVGPAFASTSTSLALSGGSNPASAGSALTFTATVAGSTPTDKVTFYDGVTRLGTGTLNASFQATFTTSSLALGAHAITARYEGNAANDPSVSTALAIQIAEPATILSFTFPGLPATTISGNNISVTVPYATAVTALVPTYTIFPGATGNPPSGSIQDFTSPVHYVVTGQDASQKDYAVTVNKTPASSARDILTFVFPGLSATAIGSNTITLTVPFGTDVTALAPTYTVSPLALPDATFPSGTIRNFSTPQTYTITAENGSTKNYAVTVTVAAASSAKDILTCNFGTLGAATISGTNISVYAPPTQSLTSLAPTFTLSPFATLSPLSGTPQDFTNPVTYTVTAQNGSTKVYTVAVTSYQSWGYSGSLYILTTPDGANLPASAATETNFPLLVRLNSGNFPFSQAQSDGRDLRFATAAGAMLSYQIEQWDAVNQRAAVWVKIPAITGNARQEIKIYWGKSGVATASSGSSVFSSSNGYASVHHMSDTLADTVGTTTPTNSSTTASNGLIGRSRTFAAGQGIQCGTAITGLPTGSGPFSTGVWIRPSTSGNVLLGWGLEQGQGKVIVNLTSPPRIRVDGYFGGADISGTAAIPTSEWSYVVQTFQSTACRLYVNGVLDASTGGGVMNMPTPCRFDIGGFVPTHGFNFVGDMDEVRIANVTRTANWVKLEYENQKPVQTLVGGIVPSGSDFSVTPTSVTMNERATTTLTAQAGGAQKVYWIYKKNGQETLLATDQLTFNYTAPRISGNDSATIQFKAVFAGGTQTIDVPLTVLDTVPDPVFTLVPSTTSWDGRTTMTVTANISNLAAMQAAGFGTLNYKWTVSGVAVIKQTSNGTLTLTRSQGSGPMTASLTIDNGGAPVTNSVIINVQEPASDPWVQRTPAANEKPVNKQFFARDPGTGLGTIYYRGTQAAPATDVYLKIYTTDTGADVLYATHRQTLVATAYSFAAPIAAGKVTYKVTYGTTSGGNDSAPLATVSDLVCGDAFIIEGQSNALATDNSAPNDTTTTNKWVRTYGLSSHWGYGISKGNDLQLGLWGWYLANRLVANNNMPVFIINGAIGGTRIDVHRPNPANHSLPLGSGYGENSYADLYNRVVGAKLTHGIRAVLWHQGEQDQGTEGPDGDYDYKFYQQYFVDISAAWKQDFPNLQKYYIFQIWPAACGSMSNGSDDKLREKQRTLPYLYSNMRIMSTLGIVPGSGCHYEPAGYQVFSDLIGPLVEQDNYGYLPGSVFTAPDLKKAWFTTSAHTGITLEFDQNMAWNTGAPSLLFLDGVANKVASGSVSGKVIKLTLTAASTASTITYLQGTGWNGVQGNLLYGTNSIAALTFADVPLALPPPMGLTAVQNNNQVVLNWTAPSSGATGYKIKRSLTSGSGYVQINTAAGTTFTDTNVTNGTTYYYVVSATNGSDEGLNSAEASVTLVVIGTGVTTTTLVRHSGTGSATTYGDALSFDVTVSGSSTPTGLVTLKDGGAGGTTIGSATLAGGTCTIAPALAALTPGSHDNLVAVYSGDITFASNTSGALDTQTVSPKALTVTGTAVTSKTYNGTTTATLTGATLSGVVGGDTVTLGNATSGTFNSKDAGTGKTVTPAMTISGSSAGYYTLTQPVLTGTITPKALTVTGTTVATKPYDGSTAAALAGGTLSGVVGGDEVTLNASGTFNTKDVGTGKVVTSTSTLAGAQKANYTLTQPAGLTGTITALVVTLSGSRTYDGTTNVAAASLAIGNKVGGDDLSLTGSASLAGKDVGSQALVSGTPIMRVQAATGNTGTSAATTINVTLGTIPTNGNTLVAVIATRGTTADRVSGISGGGVTWSRVSQAVNAGGTTTEIWYGPNVSNGTKAVSITQAALFSAAVVMEYGGVLAPASFDVAANNTGNSTTASTGATATTAQAYELCVGGIGLPNSGYTLDSPNNSFAAVASAKSTNTTAGSNSVVYALEKILTATGTASSGGTVSTSSQWSGAMATFKAVQAVPTPGVPMRVQSATGNTGASAATTIPVNMGTAPANGNTMVAVISTRGTSSGLVTSITQTGAAWTRAAQTVGTAGTTTEIWYAPNVSGAAAAVTINQASLLSAAVVLEYSGVLAVSPLDKTASITGSSTAAATGTTVATTQAIELWIGGSGLVSSSYTLGNPNNSFTAVASAQSTGAAASNAKVYALERIVGGTGTASSGGTVSTTSQWSGAIATFKAAATLTLGGAAAANYTLIGATGAVAITPADLTITADNQSKTYGQSVTFGSGSTQFTSNGLQNGETIGSVTLACDGGGAAAEAASYPITPGAATAGTFSAANYAISYVPGTLTVNPASFATWALDPAQGLTAGVNDGPLQDPDHDGISNLLEFVLRTAPMTPSTTALPAIQQDGGQWVFEYDRNDDSLPPATTQVVQYGSDLSDWTDITIPATSSGAVTITPGMPTDHVRVVIPNSGGKVFARLKASQ